MTDMILILLYDLAVKYGGVATVGLVLFLFAVKTSKEESGMTVPKQRNWRPEIR